MIEYKNLHSEPLKVILQLVGAKWKLLIIQELIKHEMRFTELRKKLGCTAKILTSCLKDMEDDGLIVKETESINNIKRTDYYLTDIGYTLKPVIDSMNKWGKDYKKLRKLMERENEYKISRT